MNDEQQIELSIKEAKSFTVKKDALQRLANNTDFKLLFIDGYFKEESSRLVLAMADPSMQTEELQGQLKNDIIAVGRLDQYLRAVNIQGDMAQKAITDNEAYLEELRKG
jgi:hypothetical protein